VKFPESALAHRYLDGLVGVEIGGAAHNPFGLATWNVDQRSHHDPATELYREAQREQCGEVLPVDIVAPGDRLPIRDGAIDFVVSSHVIEHFFDPVGAIEEWARVSRR
jgi:SAM-dependent methyltransferase